MHVANHWGRSCAWAVACAAVAIAAACGGGRGAAERRERAYQANNRGVAALEQFEYETAAARFRDALQIDESLAIAHVNLGLALLYAQDLAGAAAEAAEAARLLPSAPEPHYVLGLVARAENRSEDALREFEAVRTIDPTDVGAAVNIGQILLEDRRYGDAIAALEPAVEREPFNVTAAYNLGLALTRDGQADAGRAMLDRSQALRATGYAVTYGTGYLEQGRYAEAIASTGAEPELVDADVPAAAFTAESVAGPREPAPAVRLPFGRTFSAAELAPDRIGEIAASLGGCVALADVDGDGDLDLFEASGAGQRLLRQDGGAWADATPASGLEDAAGGAPIGCLAADYDNDGQVDLFVLRHGRSSLYRNQGRFVDATAAAGIPPYTGLPGAAAFADVDHDGDLDLVIAGLADLDASRALAAAGPLTFPRDFAPAPLQLLRNNGDGTFADITAAANLQAAGHAIAVVPTDFDNRRDLDLLVVNAGGAPRLFRNLRDGTFADVAGAVGLAAIVANREVTAVSAADVNKDDFPDFFFGAPGGGVLALSDGRGAFTGAAEPAGVEAGLAAQFVDYDRDGLMDLLTWSSDGPRLARHLGDRWSDVSAASFPRPASGPAPSSARAVALADLDGDGRTDLVTADARSVGLWRNSGDEGRTALRVDLTGRVSNRRGTGSKVQVRAGSLRSRIELSNATPPVGPVDVVFGLGSRPGADAVRVLWPSGILQAEVRDGLLPTPLPVEELDRKPSSCPFLFTWDGERFAFITDFMGGGEMGYWEAPGRRNHPDPVEYVRIPGDQLRARDGRFEIRVTNELEETLFADRFQLLAVAHPPDIGVYPDEGMTEPPKPFRLFQVTGARVPRAVDDTGADVTDRLTDLDRRYPDGFGLGRIRGYAEPHTLTLDLAPVAAAPVLLMTAWTDYAFSSDNLAASQAGLALTPPALEARGADGRWRSIVPDIGIPVGRPQTVTVDLAGRLRSGEHEVRIVTNMRIYWDRILVADAVGGGARITRLDPMTATLRERGFSAEVQPGGTGPIVYDYARTSPESPWKVMPGRYTRVGDVRDLLTAADDMFVIAKPGDEMAILFDAAALEPLPDGWTRTFLLLADGFSKEMDINSSSPDRVEPLPFHAMTAYPYAAPEHYPDTPAHEQYQAQYNTRVVTRTIPPLTVVTSPTTQNQ